MPKITTFTEAQDALRPFYNNAQTKFSLDNIRALMKFLGDPQDSLKVVHIAGTSGKTSTSYYSAALLKASGKSVGLMVSPHVDAINERLQVNGEPLPEAEFCRVLSEFLDTISQSDVRPSYFEIFVAMAYWEFARRGLEYAVIEVGLGGRLDATNIVTRADKLCLITDIGLDHTEILGNTLGEIAHQKACIIQDDNQVFMYQQSTEVTDVVQAIADQHHAQLNFLQSTDSIDFVALPPFQQRNLGLARRAIDFALQRDAGQALTDEAIAQAASIVVPARLEQFKLGNKTIIVDGSHNQQKIHALLEGMQKLHPDQPFATLCAFVKANEQRWQGGIDELMQRSQHIIFTGFHGEQDLPRSSVDPLLLQTYCEQKQYKNTVVEQVPAAALATLLARPESLLVVTGSFYLLNHIRPVLKGLV